MNRIVEISEWDDSDSRGSGFSIRLIDKHYGEYTSTHEFNTRELDSVAFKRISLFLEYQDDWSKDSKSLESLE